MATLSGKKKLSAVTKLTIVFTVITITLVVSITLILRVAVVNSSMASYANDYIRQITPLIKLLVNNREFEAERESGFPDLMPDIFKSGENAPIRGHLLVNKIIIWDGKILSDPYNVITKDFKMSKNPELFNFNGMYYIFINFKIPPTESFPNETIVVVGNYSLEFTALLKTFDFVSNLMIIIGSIIAFLISSTLAQRTLKPVSEISKQLIEIDVDTLDRRIPSQNSEEFQSLAEKLNNMLEKVEKGYVNQKNFVSDVSHELRTPLTSISGYVSMLKRWGSKDEEIMNESIENIETSASYLKKLVENLLLLSKPDFKIENSEISVKETAEEIASIYRNESNFIEVKGEDFIILSSKEYLSIIIKALIENAIKYSGEKPEIKIELGDKEIRIKDNGIGISEEEMEKIFDKFYKGDTSRNNDGYGLGLAIVKKLTDMMGIKIEVESKVNEGSVFTLKF